MRRRVRVIVQVLGIPPLNPAEVEIPIAESREYAHLDIPIEISPSTWCDQVAKAVRAAVEKKPAW